MRRDDLHARAEIGRAVDIVCRNIKVQRRLIAEHVVRPEVKLLIEPLKIPDQHPVRQEHALRHARGAAGKEHVGGVIFRHGFLQRRERRRIHVRRRQIVEKQDLRLRRGCAGVLRERRRRNHGARLQHAHNQPDALERHLRVDRAVEGAAAERAEIRRDTVRAFFEINGDRRLRGVDSGRQRRADPPRGLQHFAEGVGGFEISVGALVRIPGRRALQKGQ